jgi:hypothetical protein
MNQQVHSSESSTADRARSLDHTLAARYVLVLLPQSLPTAGEELLRSA